MLTVVPAGGDGAVGVGAPLVADVPPPPPQPSAQRTSNESVMESMSNFFMLVAKAKTMPLCEGEISA
jgi:hypothetical protein